MKYQDETAILESLLQTAVLQISAKLNRIAHKEFSLDYLREKDIAEKLIAGIPNLSLNYLKAESEISYPNVPNNRCDLVLTNTHSNHKLWCEIKILKRRDRSLTSEKQLKITRNRKETYSDLVKLCAYTPPSDSKYFLFCSSLNPSQLYAEWRRAKPIHRQFADLFNPAVNLVKLKIVFNQETDSIIEAISKRLKPILGKEKMPQELSFSLFRITREHGSELREDFAGLYLFRIDNWSDPR